jgi:hypothetical protein
LRNEFNCHFSFVRRKWAKESFSIAMQFSDPETVIHADRVGWSQERLRFQFPKFAILAGGNVDPTPIPIRHEDGSIPASGLAAPVSCRSAIALLSRSSPETQIIWAIAACVAHNLLAGNCLREPVGVVLDGQFAHSTGVSAAIALGCGDVDVTKRGNSSILQYVSTQCGAHDYLSVVKFGTRIKPQICTAWLDDSNIRRAVLPLPEYAAIAVSSHSGFVRIKSHEFPQPLGPLSSAAGWIIPAYLEDVCRRKKLIDVWARKNELLSVVNDMAEWLDGLGGNPNAIRAAENLFVFDAHAPAMALVELTERMRQLGDIECLEIQAHPDGPEKVPVATIMHCSTADRPQCIQLRHWVINEILRRKRVPAIRPVDVVADLETRSVLIGTIEEKQGTSWLIDSEWWAQMTANIGAVKRVGLHRSVVNCRNDGPSGCDFLSQQHPLMSNSEP